jgi:hypothetical protein
MFQPRPCDGSCLIKHPRGEELKFQEGPSLFFYWCWHEQTWVLTNYQSPKAIKPRQPANRLTRKEGER